MLLIATLNTVFQLIRVKRRKTPREIWYNTPWNAWKIELANADPFNWEDVAYHFKRAFGPVTPWTPDEEKPKYTISAKSAKKD